MNLCDAIKEAIRLKSIGVTNGTRGMFFGQGKGQRLMVNMTGDSMPVWDDDFVSVEWRPIE